MKAQTIFNTVVRHLAKQGKKSASRRRTLSLSVPIAICKYRGPGGTSCAVGCLIKDAEYKASMEGRRVTTAFPLPKRLRPHLPLLSYLQYAHDFATAGDTLRGHLLAAAKRFNLKTSVLDKAKFPEVWR